MTERPRAPLAGFHRRVQGRVLLIALIPLLIVLPLLLAPAYQHQAGPGVARGASGAALAGPARFLHMPRDEMAGFPGAERQRPERQPRYHVARQASAGEAFEPTGWPVAAAERRALYLIAPAFGVALLLFVLILRRRARAVFKPLQRMESVMRAVQAGDPGARLRMPVAGDEISRVAAQLDQLLDQLQEREQRLRDRAEMLERRVKDRTADLEQANLQLDQTMRQLNALEKLATIGEITAGVAHEINNPLAVIQGNLDVVREDLGPRGDSLRTEFTLIQQQIQAIQLLVSKLPGFARPEESAGGGSGLDPCRAIRDTLPLVQHLLNRSAIRLELDLQASGLVSIDLTELQQVLVNLMVNAIQAMPNGGVLRISASDRQKSLQIIVEDTGTGMTPTVLSRVFEPFFTTKQAGGTGLGLSVSRRLIARAGGNILASSTLGQGTRFEITLPAR